MPLRSIVKMMFSLPKKEDSLSGHVAPIHKFIFNGFLVNGKVKNNSGSGNRSNPEFRFGQISGEFTDLSKYSALRFSFFLFLQKAH